MRELLIIAGIVGLPFVLIALGALVTRNAPKGYEDKTGFHYGEKL
jgi:hypothetical protein